MITVHSIEHHECERVLDLFHEWLRREFFRHYFEHGPAFCDDLNLVAEEDGRLVSTLQIIPKIVRLGGGDLRVGGIGNVFTSESHRHRGVASRVLRRAGARDALLGILSAAGETERDRGLLLGYQARSRRLSLAVKGSRQRDHGCRRFGGAMRWAISAASRGRGPSPPPSCR